MEKGKIIIYVSGTSNNKFSIDGKRYTGYGIHCYVAKNTGKSVGIRSKFLATTHGYYTKPDIATPLHINKVLKSSGAFPKETNKKIDKLELYKVYDIYGYDNTVETEKEITLIGMIKAVSTIPYIIIDNKDIEITEVMLVLDSIYTLSYSKRVLLGLLDLEKINENKELLTKLQETILKVNESFKINLSKLLPDSNDIGNNKSKLLANMGVKQHSLNKDKSDFELLKFDNEYWKDVKTELDLFYYKELFNFHPDETLSNKLYYGINYKDLADFGKKLSNITYTIVNLPGGEEYIDKFLILVRKLLGTLYVPYVLMLDMITNKMVIKNYTLYGEDYIVPTMTRQMTIRTTDDIVLAETLYPTGLSNIVMNNFLKLVTEYHDIKNEESFTTTKDITELIYDISDKGKYTIKKEFVNDKYIIKVPYKVSDEYRAFTIRVKPKLDLPNRNKLKRYEKLNPKVILSITKIQEVIEYKTLVTLSNDVDIFSDNIYANKIFLRKKK